MPFKNDVMKPFTYLIKNVAKILCFKFLTVENHHGSVLENKCLNFPHFKIWGLEAFKIIRKSTKS